MPAAVKEYDARIDIKKRVTIRGAQHEYYLKKGKASKPVDLSSFSDK